MKKIFKYELPIIGLNQIQMPVGSKLLCVQMQGDVICLWALVDPDRLNWEVRIMVIGTGHEVESNLHYIGTVQQLGGTIVWHIFEE